jgi:hypothetical protein
MALRSARKRLPNYLSELQSTEASDSFAAMPGAVRAA